jgi:transposase
LSNRAQSDQFGGEAQVDWYEGWVEFDCESRMAYVFCIRSMASGGAFHRAHQYAAQQAFLEAHELAFAWFGGVFRILRYDSLKSAVKKILRGHQRGRLKHGLHDIMTCAPLNSQRHDNELRTNHDLSNNAMVRSQQIWQ